MHRINGEKFGRWSLRLDAAYCVLLGLGVALFAERIASGIALASWLVATVGIAVVVWAGGVLWMLSQIPLRRALRLVMTANLLAAIAVGLVSVTAATALVVIAIITVAVDIALFAVSQAVALRTLPPRAVRPALQ